MDGWAIWAQTQAISESTTFTLGLLITISGLLGTLVWYASRLHSKVETSLDQNKEDHSQFRIRLHDHANKIQALDGRTIKIETRLEGIDP